MLSQSTRLDFLGEYVVDAGEQAVLAAVHPGDDAGQAQIVILLHDLGSLPLPRYVNENNLPSWIRGYCQVFIKDQNFSIPSAG